MNNGAKEIQILFSSLGGVVDEGFALHNFLRALPVSLSMHCIGSADSIALIVFLAADRRLCTSDATFLFHDFNFAWQTPVSFTRVQLRELYESLERSRLRSQELLKTRAKFTDADFQQLALHDQAGIYGAEFAKEKGIVHEIAAVRIPVGSVMHNLEF